MLFKALLPLLILFFSFDVRAKTTSFPEQISVSLFVSGDFQGEFDFNGSLGELIRGTSDSSEPRCKIASLFRKVKYRTQNTIEVWLKFDCTIEGQKSSYKPHRIFLQPHLPSQKITLPMLAKNLKNIQLEFRGISLKSGK